MDQKRGGGQELELINLVNLLGGDASHERNRVGGGKLTFDTRFRDIANQDAAKGRRSAASCRPIEKARKTP